MCGIFGLWHFDERPAAQSDLARMSEHMIHRGPDDEGYFISGSIGIGMRRLSIIDLEGGHQPIDNEDGNIHIVFNGEIFNYSELRQTLVERGHVFKTKSDTEVIVHLYEDMGRDCVNLLNGMFAIAIWDARDQSLWVARDRLGIKPLFWTNSRGSLYFSSDLNALNAVIKAPVSASSIVRYLGFSYVPGPYTMFEGIHKLLPGEQLVAKNGAVGVSRYWQLPVEQRKITVSEARDQLDALLSDATRLQMVSDVPVGVFLSGGVDSSAVAAYAAKHSQNKSIQTFTVEFADKDGADAAHASDLAKTLGSEHIELRLDFNDQLSLLDQLIKLMDEPMADNAIVPTFALSREASKRGIKVMLSGAGGDEIFGGYDRHIRGRMFSSSWFSQLPKLLRWALKPAWFVLKPAMVYRLHNAARNFFISTSGTDLSMLRNLLRDRREYEKLLADFDAHEQAFTKRNAYDAMRLDLQYYLPDNILSLTDKATMAASVEGRVPLLDHRLVEFAFSLPERVNLLNGEKKGLFRSTLKRKLPDSILNRGKEGFNAPTGIWLEQWIDKIKGELLGDPSPTLERLLNIRAIEPWFDDAHIRRRGAELIYALYVLSRWLKEHYD